MTYPPMPMEHRKCGTPDCIIIGQCLRYSQEAGALDIYQCRCGQTVSWDGKSVEKLVDYSELHVKNPRYVF